MTRVIPIHEVRAHMTEILDTFTRGGVVLYPTDTQYGLGVVARNAAAVQKVRAIKKALEHKSISIIVPDRASVERYVHIDDTARALMDLYLPGALTLILPAKDKALAESRGNEHEIGIRIPDAPETLEIVQALGEPITTTSANISGREPATTCAEILNTLDGVDLAIDGGVRDHAASTIVRCAGGVLEVMRQGSVILDLQTFV